MSFTLKVVLENVFAVTTILFIYNMRNKIIRLIKDLEDACDNAETKEIESEIDIDLHYWKGRRHSYESVISRLRNMIK